MKKLFILLIFLMFYAPKEINASYFLVSNFEELQLALENTNVSTIKIGSNIYSNASIIINRPIKIIGEYRIISSVNASAIIINTNGVLELEGPTITRSNSGGLTRGVTINGGHLILREGYIKGHSTLLFNGAGIFMTGSNSKFTMYGGAVKNNNSGFFAGGIEINSNNAIVTINGGYIKNNSAVNGGGAIRIANSTSSLYINGGVIKRNIASGIPWGSIGGAIFVESVYNLHLNGGYIKENSATGTGGAISLPNLSSLYMNIPISSYVVFINNNAQTGIIVNENMRTRIDEEGEFRIESSTSNRWLREYLNENSPHNFIIENHIVNNHDISIRNSSSNIIVLDEYVIGEHMNMIETISNIHIRAYTMQNFSKEIYLLNGFREPLKILAYPQSFFEILDLNITGYKDIPYEGSHTIKIKDFFGNISRPISEFEINVTFEITKRPIERLGVLINYANSKNREDYSLLPFLRFQAILNSAINVYNNNLATNAQINIVYNSLRDAIRNLS